MRKPKAGVACPWTPSSWRAAAGSGEGDIPGCGDAFVCDGGCDTSSAVSYSAKLAWLPLRPYWSPVGMLPITAVPCSHSVFLFDSPCVQKLLCNVLFMVWSVWRSSFSSTLPVGAQAMSGNFECVMHTVYTHVCMLPLLLRWYVLGCDPFSQE